MGWAEHVARTRKEEKCMQGFGGKPEGKRPLGRPMRRWEDNIKMDIQEVGRGEWNLLIWLRIGTGCEHF